jgi:hypothetical protein
MTAPTPPADSQLDEIITDATWKRAVALRDLGQGEEYDKAVLELKAEAKAKLQALISQEAVRLANLVIGDDEPPIVASTPQGVVRKLLRDEQRQRLVLAALTKGGDTGGLETPVEPAK